MNATEQSLTAAASLHRFRLEHGEYAAANAGYGADDNVDIDNNGHEPLGNANLLWMSSFQLAASTLSCGGAL